MLVATLADASRRSARLLAGLAAAATLSLGLPSTARAQDVLDVKSATEVRDRYLADLDTVHAKVMALANAIPEDKYSWRRCSSFSIFKTYIDIRKSTSKRES